MFIFINIYGFPSGLVSKEATYNAGYTGDTGSIPGLGRILGGGHGNACQYSCLEKPMGRGAWWSTVHGFAKSWTQLKFYTHTPVLLPGKSHGWRSLVGCSPWGRWEWAWLSGFTFTFHFHALGKEMATHSSVLAWRIPGTGEPGGLPSMESHRVGHDWSDLAAAAAAYVYVCVCVCVCVCVYGDMPTLKLTY